MRQELVLKEDSEENEGMAILLDWDTGSDTYLLIHMLCPKRVGIEGGQ